MVKVRVMERKAKCDKCKCDVLAGEPMVGWPARYGPAKYCRICGAKYLASLLVELATFEQRKPTTKEQTTLLTPPPTKCLNGMSSSRKSEKNSEQKIPHQAPLKGGKPKKAHSFAGNAVQ